MKDKIKGNDLTNLKTSMRYLIRNQYPTYKGQSKHTKIIYDYAINNNLRHQSLVDFLMESIQLK